MTREHAWKAGGGGDSPLVRYILDRGPRGTIVSIERNAAARCLGIDPHSVNIELRQLQNAGALRYSADYSGTISVRVLE